jgi:hypothetical protein
MKIRKQASTAALASVLLFSNIPLAMADEMMPASTMRSIPASAPGSGSSVAPEDAKITKDQAIELAKSYITIPEGYTVNSVNLSSNNFNGNKGVYWNVSFNKLVENKNIGSMNITINGINGKLLEYSSYSNDPDYKPSYPPKVDYQGAKGIAAEWVAKLNANEHEQLLYNDNLEQSLKAPLNGSNLYSIRYDRIHNGVAFPQNGINVQVNGDGAVTQYSFNWDEGTTFEKAAPISEEAAAQAFRDKAVLKLNYLMLYEAKGEKKPNISYNMEPIILNAATGELWKQGLASNAGRGPDQTLTSAPLSQPSVDNLNLTKEQALEKISSTFMLPQGIKQEEASYNETTNPITGEVQSIWNLRWSQATTDEAAFPRGGSSIWATVNSKTGEITNFSRNTYIPYTEQKAVEPKVTAEEAKVKAVDFVKKQIPAHTDQLVLDTSAMDNITAEQIKMMNVWEIPFKRMIDGVYVNAENVHVAIDKATGDIMNYQFNFSNIAYPKQKPEIIDANKAKELLLSPYTIKLNYVLPNQQAGILPIEKIRVMMAAGELPPGSDVSGQLDTEAKLVYVLTPKYSGDSYFLDAVTGQWRNSSNGEVMTLEKVHVTDIDGHWAQKELQIMLDYQALDVADGKVIPDASITRGELIKMLIIAMNGGRSGISYGAERAASFKDVRNESPFFAYVENAVDRGLIDRGKEFNPQAIMNREEMAELIVRALGYKKLTAYEPIFSDSFKDAGSLKNRGEAAIVIGLGIMTLSEGSFNPKLEVTRAQAAAAFFRYLEKASELQSGNRYY